MIYIGFFILGGITGFVFGIVFAFQIGYEWYNEEKDICNKKKD